MNCYPTESQWADLPKELLETIGKHLDSRIDVYRFRAVCSSWRSSLSSLSRLSPSILILNLPPPLSAAVFFSVVTVCRIELLDGDANPNCWLTKVEESTRGEMQLLIPLSNRQIKIPNGMTKFLNLLNFRLVELTKACTLKLASGRPVLGVDKAVLFPNRPRMNSLNHHDLGILAIFHEGKLGFWKNGDKAWTLLDDTNFHYDDIVFYKGNYYVVDRFGGLFLIDSSLNLIKIYSAASSINGDKKNLVESCGDLYLVDRYFDGERRIWQGNEGEHIINQERFNSDELFYNLLRSYPKCKARSVDFKVYKLDEECGTWVDVKSLDDRIFVLSSEVSFSVSANDFKGGEGNCMYYTDPNDENFGGELSGYDARVFRLKDHSSAKGSCFPGCSQIAQPLCRLGPLSLTGADALQCW